MRTITISMMFCCAMVACSEKADIAPEAGSVASARIVAKILDETVPSGSGDEVFSKIVRGLLKNFAVTNDIHATEEEIDAYKASLDDTMEAYEHDREVEYQLLLKKLNSDDLSDEEREQLREQVEDYETRKEQDDLQGTPEEHADADAAISSIARDYVTMWKVNKALYQKYGGRIANVKFGVVPIDAIEAYIREAHAQGKLEFMDAAFEKAFWETFGDEDDIYIYDDKEEGEKFINTPIWDLEVPDE